MGKPGKSHPRGDRERQGMTGTEKKEEQRKQHKGFLPLRPLPRCPRQFSRVLPGMSASGWRVEQLC